MNQKPETTKKIKYVKYTKRLVDFFISLILIIILMPLFIVIPIIIKIDDYGPALYKQKRVGQYRTEFEIIKFRTMNTNAEDTGPTYTQENDIRITRVGKWLRKTSIDELPQLFNVLKGDMSLIGHRPGLMENYPVDYLKTNVFLLKPGITGYAQVNGRSRITTAEKRQWELKYYEDISFKTDIEIILKTIKVVLDKETAY